MVLPLGDLAETDTDKFFSLEKRVPSEYCLRFDKENVKLGEDIHQEPRNQPHGGDYRTKLKGLTAQRKRKRFY
ncbi:hypothetical protein AAZX31_02G167100 [Glycine max]